MPRRPILVARLCGVLMQPMVRLVTVLKSPHRDVVRVIDEIGRKKEGGEAAPAGPETPAG
jgi:hypothetical protein